MEQTILVDDREKKPYSFPGMEVEQARLNVGDYTIKGFEDVFAVERKSLNDLTRSVGTDRTRFEDEIKRAQDLDNFTVVIESSVSDVYARRYYSKIHPNAVFGTVKKWPWKYGTLEFVWAGETPEGEPTIPMGQCREAAKQETLRLLDRWYLQAATDLF